MLNLPIEQKNSKIDLNDNNELINPSEEKSNENLNNEIKIEPIKILNEDQVVIPNEFIQSNKIIKRRIIMNLNCPKCQQKFKTKNQLNSHLIKCQHQSQPT